MKPYILSFISGLLLFVQLNVCAQTASTLPVDSGKIHQVENGLVGAIQTEGELPERLKDRMAHYHVNGISIAVIKDYKILWAKGYGFADADRKVPVTDQT